MRHVESPIFTTARSVPPTGSGSLDGWRLAVKDNIDVAGLPTTGGTRFLRDHVPAADAEVVERLRSHGASIVGKTNMHELGHGITGVNPSYGTTAHPDDVEYTVGGSSGGSALAVLAGHARAALGTDTGGSVRIPAAFTGLVGYRPSTGRYPSRGVLHISPTRDTVGVIARSVSDVRAIDRVLSARPITAGQTIGTVGVPAESRAMLSPQLASLFDAAVASVKAKGIEVCEIETSRLPERCFELGLVVLRFETLAAISAYLAPSYGEDAVAQLIAQSESDDVRAILTAAAETPVPLVEYRSARKELRRIDEVFSERMAARGIVALMYPTVSGEPPRVEPPGSAVESMAQLGAIVRNSTPATVFGTPAINLPMGRSAVTGLPSGFTLEHLERDDNALLTLAQRLESETMGAA